MISNFSLKQHFQFSLWSEVPGWVISTPSRLKRGGGGGVLRLRSAVTIALRLGGVEALWNPARLLHEGSLRRVTRRWLPAEVKNKSLPSSASTLLSSPQHLHLPLRSFTPSPSLFTHRCRFLFHRLDLLSIFLSNCIVSSSDLRRLCFHIFSLLFSHFYFSSFPLSTFFFIAASIHLRWILFFNLSVAPSVAVWPSYPPPPCSRLSLLKPCSLLFFMSLPIQSYIYSILFPLLFFFLLFCASLVPAFPVSHPRSYVSTVLQNQDDVARGHVTKTQVKVEGVSFQKVYKRSSTTTINTTIFFCCIYIYKAFLFTSWWLFH